MAMEGTYDNGMPSRYTSEPDSSSTGRVDMEYVKGLRGIMKIVEGLFSLASFICAVASSLFLNKLGGGWVAFVGMTAFLISIVWYIFYAFRIIERLPQNVPWHFVMFVYSVVYTVFYFISGIVCAVRGYIPAAGAGAEFCYEVVVALAFCSCGIVSSIAAISRLNAAAAAAFFSFATMILFGVDCYFVYQAWRASGEGTCCGGGGSGTGSRGPQEMGGTTESGREAY